MSGGFLSFYAASAGREAATSLAFNLDAGSGTEGAIESPSVSPVVGVSTGGLLAQVAGVAVQQVGQLLSFSGSALDLVTTLLDGVGGAGPVGRGVRRRWRRPGGRRAALDGGRGGAGLRRGQARGGSRRGRAGRRRPAIRREPPLQPEVKQLPPWERLAVGLDRAWKQVRDEFLGKEGQAEVVQDRKPPAPNAASPAPRNPRETRPGVRARLACQAATASRPSGVSSIDPAHDTSGSAGPSDRREVVDSALEDLAADADGGGLLPPRGAKAFAATAVAIASTLAAERIRRRYVRRVGATHQFGLNT